MDIELYKYYVNDIRNTQKALNKLLIKTEERMPDKVDMYSSWINEEFHEFMAEKDGTPEQFKELCDLIWVCIQKANKQGYNLAEGMKALVDEYCSKFYTADGKYEPIYREDGKLLKNTGFKKADFTKLIHKE